MACYFVFVAFFSAMKKYYNSRLRSMQVLASIVLYIISIVSVRQVVGNVKIEDSSLSSSPARLAWIRKWNVEVVSRK